MLFFISIVCSWCLNASYEEIIKLLQFCENITFIFFNIEKVMLNIEIIVKLMIDIKL